MDPSARLKVVQIPFDQVHLDPNNPRIAPDDPPGYADAARITDPAMQRALADRIGRDFDISELEGAIIGQGWVPMDAVVVWRLAGKKPAYVVIEGNRRTTALRRLRDRLDRERRKLEAMRGKKRGFGPADLAAQERLVAQLVEVVRDTESLKVSVVEAGTPAELAELLPRIMGVRHLAGVKEWPPYARGLYILGRYQELFDSRRPGENLRMEKEIVQAVAEEVSQGETVTRRAIQATAAFSHFKRGYADRLPEGEEFEDGDYYLFELLVKKPFLRDRFGFGDADLSVSGQGEEALFEWVFKEPRPNKAEDNANRFYRHENVILWDQMKKYDGSHGTAFALRFDVSSPAEAPEMRVVEADWRLHEARQNPVDVIQRLINELGQMKTEVLVDSAAALGEQLTELDRLVKRYKKIVTAAQE